MATTRTTCPLDCPDACGVLVESDAAGQFLSLRGEREHGWSRGSLCRKTAHFGDLIEGAERLRTPLLRAGRKSTSELRPASWEEALARIAERVGPLRGRGERILACWYAGTMGRVQRLFPLRAMHALGATFIDGGICDSATSEGHLAVLGHEYGADLERAGESDFLLLWGCDMRRTVQHLQAGAREIARRGQPVAAIDIYRTETIAALERWGGEGFVIRPGTDAALALGLARLAFERGFADRAALESCTGAEAFERHVRAGHSLAETSAITGLAPERIERLATWLSRAREPLLKTGVGFGRRRNGGMSMRAVCSLAAVLGRADRLHYESGGCFEDADAFLARPDLRPGRGLAPTIPQVQTGRLLLSGRFDALFVWGHNPAVVCPEARVVREALARDELFTVVHDPFLTETARQADVVLPATFFPEHPDVYRSYGHRRLRLARRAALPPPGPRSNVATFSAIARVLDLPPDCQEQDEERLCHDFALAVSTRLSPEERLRLLEGEAVRCDPPHGPGHGTPSGKVELYSERLASLGHPPMASYVPDDAAGEAGAFWLLCAPSIHTHNSTFSHSPRHLARRGVHRAFLNPAEAARLGIAEGDPVTLYNRRAALTFPAALSEDLPAGLVRVDGLPRSEDVPEGIGVNALVPDALSDLGDGNVLYSTRVDLRPARAAPA
jgi:anaerobic selenocysteine-containing dehydrogenase